MAKKTALMFGLGDEEPDESESGSSDSDSAANDLLDAIAAKDTQGIVSAIREIAG